MTSRRQAIGAALALAIPLLLAGTGSVEAADGNGCLREWNKSTSVSSGSRKCSFVVNGTPITVNAEARGSSNASVRVWVTPGDNPELEVYGCEASGEKVGSTYYAQCGGSLTPLVADPVIGELPGGNAVVFYCHAEWSGNMRGSAFCGSPEPCDDMVADLADDRSCLGLQVP
jgi:hypothetical protein